MNPTLRNGLRLLLKVDIHVLLAVILLGFSWMALDMVSIRVAADNNPGLSFYDLLKFINSEGGLRTLIDPGSKGAGMYGAVMWLALLLPLAHCWYAHKYLFLACAAPLAYMLLCAVGVYARLLHKVSGLYDFGSVLGGARGRSMVNDMLARIWGSMSFEAGFYIAAVAVMYLAGLGVVKLFKHKYQGQGQGKRRSRRARA